MSLMGKDVAETDMICGGEGEVFFEPLLPNDEDRIGLLGKLAEIQKRGGSGLLVTVVDAERWANQGRLKVFIDSKGERTGGLGGMKHIEDELQRSLPQRLQKREPVLAFFETSAGERVEIFVEPVLSDPFLYIFGGGHVSSQIAPLASKVGFRVVVVEDRAEYADPEKFPDAEEVYCYPFDGVVERFPVDESSYIIIVTRGHLNDKTILEQSLRTRAGYIGMIGSRRKKAMIYEKLLEEGFTRKDLDRVYAPIGLNIGAETPEEIAVSIVAELIQVRAGPLKNAPFVIASPSTGSG
jgi:xanthine dehydrogenase accessory factor